MDLNKFKTYIYNYFEYIQQAKQFNALYKDTTFYIQKNNYLSVQR